VASADAETDPNGNPSNGNDSGLVGSTLDTVSGVIGSITRRPPKNLSDIPVVKTVDKTTATLARIATNHSLVTARSV
jgi:hypothetical protein